MGINVLVSALKSSDEETRSHAAAALGKIQSKGVRYRDIQPLLDAALGAELGIRRDAVRAIHGCRDPRAFEALCANLGACPSNQFHGYILRSTLHECARYCG